MAQQVYSWTCSICTITWVLNSTGVSQDGRQAVGDVLGYPGCVNETYGLMGSQCMVNCFAQYGLLTLEKWVGFDEAYAIAQSHTGGISPSGMYHWMAIRGVSGSDIWVANSAQGYKGVWDTISRSQFNAYGPVKVVYVESYI